MSHPRTNPQWNGHEPPGVHGRTLHDPRQIAPTGYNPPHHYQSQSSQPTSGNNEQNWNQHAQYESGQAANQSSISRGYQPPPRQQQDYALPPPQFISPAQLFQQPTQSQPLPAFHYQRPAEPTNLRLHQPTSYNQLPRITPSSAQDPQVEKAMLLVSLAEEYFEAAHAIAPAVARSMSSADVGSYKKLVATGLACLDTSLRQVKLPPRLEANIRLRYAGVLFEETENSMEAETCLAKGIPLCERNHYYDLKYAMQYMLARFMAVKNSKAAMKALDGHIVEAKTYQHFPWVYVFRFLRASIGMDSSASTDVHTAITDLKAIASLAREQGDYPIYLVASLIEAMAHLRTGGAGSMEQVRRAIAAARSNQMLPSCEIPQLTSLVHILDVVSTYEEGNSDVTLSKLKEMQKIFDTQNPAWRLGDGTIAIPIKRTARSSAIISADTRMVLGIGEDGGDTLMMSFLTKKDAYDFTHLLSGICLVHKNGGDQKGLKYLQAGFDSVKGQEEKRVSTAPGLLPELIAQTHWRRELLSYFRVIMAFCYANVGSWREMQDCLNDLSRDALEQGVPLDGTVQIYTNYLAGVWQQGTGNVEMALQAFQNESFRVNPLKGSHISARAQFERDMGILAMLNTLSIYQDPQHFDARRNTAMLTQLKPFCVGHPNKDIETAFNVMSAAVETDPPTPLFDIKNHLRISIEKATKTKNTQFLCITLSVMYKSFFPNVVGVQAEKSARSASIQAKRNGNPLWKSVADGLLSDCLNVQGKHEEAQEVLKSAQYFAMKAAEH